MLITNEISPSPSTPPFFYEPPPSLGCHFNSVSHESRRCSGRSILLMAGSGGHRRRGASVSVLTTPLSEKPSFPLITVDCLRRVTWRRCQQLGLRRVYQLAASPRLIGALASQGVRGKKQIYLPDNIHCVLVKF